MVSIWQRHVRHGLVNQRSVWWKVSVDRGLLGWNRWERVLLESGRGWWGTLVDSRWAWDIWWGWKRWWWRILVMEAWNLVAIGKSLLAPAHVPIVAGIIYRFNYMHTGTYKKSFL